MFRNFIITSLRLIVRQKGYFIINIAGLAIGIASFIFIVLYVVNELSYDRFHSNFHNIYRIRITGQMSGQELDQAISAAPMAKALIEEYPEIEHVTRIAEYGAWLIRYKEKSFNEDGIIFADSTFFDIFDFELLRGNPDKALSEPRSMVLTKSYAQKYFGNEDPMGKLISVEEDTVFYSVTGIVADPPENSHFHFDMLGSMNTIKSSERNNWVSHNHYTYIIVKDETSIPELEEKLQLLVNKYVGPQIKEILGITMDDFRNAGNFFGYYLQPLKDIHLKSHLQEEIEPNGNIIYVYIFSLIAVLTLVIAIINFVNLSTARASMRAKEVGVRKVIGSTRRNLISQFISESVFLSILATILASLLVYFLTPSFNELTGKQLAFGLFDSNVNLAYLLLLAVTVGCIAGIYPAFILASFRPALVLKGSMSSGAKSGMLRSLLVIIQFTISISIIIGTVIVYKQLSYMQNKNLGFDKEQLLVIRRPDALDNQLESFKNTLKANPNVLGVANSQGLPGKEYNNNAMFKENDPEKNMYLLMQNRVSFEYPEVMGFELVDGRFFSKEFGTDSNAVIINEKAVEVLGYENPVGKNILYPWRNNEFLKMPVIGVVKDYNIESLHNDISPVALTIMPGNWEGFLLVRLSTGNIKETVSFVEESWKKFTMKQPFQYFFFDEDFNRQYESEVKTGRIFIVFAILAIFIACLGLLGLISYSTTVRTREIGIRKVLGAGVAVIVAMLSREILKLILISVAIAWPIAYLSTQYWLNSFADKVYVSPTIYLLSALVALLIGWLVISFQTIKIALSNPVEALKYE